MRPRTSAADHARRLLALLGRLEEQGDFPLDDLAEELDTTAPELAADLTILSVCGVAPRSPDDLVPVFLDEGVVYVWGSIPGMRGPVRLSPAEAAALAAALDAAGYASDAPLTARLLQAAAASFDAASLARSLRTGEPGRAPEAFKALAGAIATHEVLEILYHSDGSEAPRLRRVEPRSLFVDRGAWYLTAWCRSADAERTFRVDRIRSVAPTGEHFAERVSHVEDAASAFAPDDLPRALLRFAAGEDFAERDWPGGSLVEVADDGSMLVEVPFAGTGWLARHISARLGRVEALDPQSVREAVATFAAAEVERLDSKRP